MNIKFYLRGQSVYIYASAPGVRVRVPVNLKAKKLTDDGKIPGDPHGTIFLSTKRQAIYKKYTELDSEGILISEQDILEVLKKDLQSKDKVKKEKKAFWTYWDEWTKESENRISEITGKKISKGTIKRYKTTKSILQQFEVSTRYNLNTITVNDTFYTKFREYIIGKKKQSINTFSDHIKQMKAFCKWLQKSEPGMGNQFRDFKKPFSYADAEPLKEAELLKLYDYETTGYKEKARLIFLFLCSTGLRISDYNNLQEKNFFKDYIFIKAQKTNAPCYIPFYDDLYFKPVELMEELKAKFGSNLKISGQKLNDHIKLIFTDDKVKITRIIPTSKTGRKTFATLKLLQSVPPEVIMKSTGHKERASFDAYVGIDTSDMLKQYRDKAIFMKVS